MRKFGEQSIFVGHRMGSATMGSLEAQVAIGVLFSLLGMVTLTLLIRLCRCVKKLDRQNREERQAPKPYAIQMALINATTTTMQPFMLATAHTNIEDQVDNHCITCNLIRMGSTCTYSDGTCPQCGNFVQED